MRLRAAVGPALFLAYLLGCAPRTPPPDLSLDPARLLAQVEEAQAPSVRVKGEARLRVRSPRGSGTLRQFAAAERPDRVHLEELDALGNPAAVLVASGGRFWLYDARAGVVYRGAATGANLARLVPLPLSAGELASILLGSAPLLSAGTPLSATADGATVRLVLGEGEVTEVLWVGAHAAVERASRTAGALAGALSYELSFSARTEQGGAFFPGEVSLRSDPAHVAVELSWTEVEVNGALDPSLFSPPAPLGARIVEVSEGGDGG